MLSHRVYYALKPYFPWRVRRNIRSIFAQQKRAKSQGVWPICEAAAHIPTDWPGWPGGRKFAVVLTHDVEGQSGLDKHARLAELEKDLGFRSSFNFIPEGDYRVTPEQRRALTENGFEVGIHDLHHDGKLFHSERSFKKHAARINQYVKEWGASGFRAGFMLRNLEWMHELDISYDASTFDTDPFEPQPDGAGTIFPFWKPARDVDLGATNQENRPAGKNGYVELPYTLPQDSTLFLILGETSPAVWIKKLDWIARHGGMALVNVHPDYLQFPGDAPSPRTFPSSYYAEFLQHIRNTYGDTYWHPLPRQMAEFTAQLQTRPVVRKKKRICMVSHSVYLSDNRVRRYAESLAQRGDEVDVFCLDGKVERPREEVVEGVRIVRLRRRQGRNEKSTLDYLKPLLAFLAVSSWNVTREHARKRYDCIHIHNIPDFMVFAAWYPKLTGTPVILDIHDIVPEFFASKFSQEPKGFMFWLLRRMEDVSAAFADQVIIANHLWKDKYSLRTRSQKKCTAFINNVDTRIFHRRARLRDDGKLIIIFPGGLHWHQGVDIAIRAFKLIADKLPKAEFHIYGAGSARDALVRLTHELELDDRVLFFPGVVLDKIADIMADADLGVVPKRADTFGNEAYSTKIMEFMSVGVPAVISSTKVDRFYFNDNVVRFFESGNVEALAEALLEVLQNPSLRKKLVDNALDYVAKNSWDTRKADYLKIVDTLCG